MGLVVSVQRNEPGRMPGPHAHNFVTWRGVAAVVSRNPSSPGASAPDAEGPTDEGRADRASAPLPQGQAVIPLQRKVKPGNPAGSRCPGKDIAPRTSTPAGTP